MSDADFDKFIQCYPIKLNEQQREAAATVDGNVLLLAVPGSGKTTVLIARLGYMLLAKNIRPENILTVTFTRAAAGDMRARYKRFFGVDAPEKLRMGTINSFCWYILRAAEDYGFPHYETAPENRTIKILSEVCRRINGIDVTKNSDNEIRSTAQEITLAKNMMVPDDEVKSDKIPNFGDIYREYNKALHDNGLIDFDDQMVFAYEILNKYPEILARIRKRYKYVCVDEAQDTSKIQHRIIEMIAEGGNLFMVGDEDQCIYAFRGGYPDALLDFRKNHPGAKVLKIEYNYRSDEIITAAAQKFIEQNRSRDASKKIRATRKGSQGMTELYVKDEYQQLMTVIAVAKNCTVDTAVLYRNNDSAIPMIDRLCALGIPFKCRELNTMFFTSPTVRDIRDIIAFARIPEDRQLFMSLYYKLGTFLRREEAEAVIRNCEKGADLLKFTESFNRIPSFKREKIADIREVLSNLGGHSAYEALQSILTALSYKEYAESKDYNPEHLRILLLVAQSQPDISALVRRLDELEDIIRADPSEPKCRFTLSTIHSSKGLEYKRVYLTDVIDGCLPMANAKIEEERRLFYVGMTRAEDELYIFTFAKENLWSQFSQFVFPNGEYAKRRGLERRGKPAIKAAIKPIEHSTVTVGKLSLETGMMVEHKIFGPGKVEKISGDVITVYFSKFGYKAISAAVCEKNGWIKKIK